MISDQLDTYRKRLKGLSYLIYNLWVTRKMTPIPHKQHGSYSFYGLQPNQVAEFDKLQNHLRKGHNLDFWKKTLLKHRGNVLCGVLMDSDQKLLGFHLHLCRKDEWKQGILHVEFSGVLPEVRGKGLASALGRHTGKYYASQGLKGVTAYTLASNFADVNNIEAVEQFGFKLMNDVSNPEGLVKLYIDLTIFLDM